LKGLKANASSSPFSNPSFYVYSTMIDHQRLGGRLNIKIEAMK